MTSKRKRHILAMREHSRILMRAQNDKPPTKGKKG